MRFSVSICCLLISLGSILVHSQNLTKAQKTILFQSVVEDEKAMAQCVRSTRESQIKEFGRILPKISGHCWDGCPTRMPKPHYPDIARRNGIKGEVIVNAIVDESGKVVFAEAVRGHGILRRYAIEAAYHSSYSRKLVCGRPIKFRWRIRYYFHPDR